jgi:hypothetical protein
MILCLVKSTWINAKAIDIPYRCPYVNLTPVLSSKLNCPIVILGTLGLSFAGFEPFEEIRRGLDPLCHNNHRKDNISRGLFVAALLSAPIAPRMLEC